MIKKRIRLIGGIAAALAVAVIAGVLWFTPGDPRDTVDSYLAAVQAKKTDEAKEFLCESWSANNIKSSKGHLVNWNGIIRYEIFDSEVGDESATVIASVSYTILTNQDSSRLRITLLRESGDWRVCEIAESR